MLQTILLSLAERPKFPLEYIKASPPKTGSPKRENIVVLDTGATLNSINITSPLETEIIKLLYL